MDICKSDVVCYPDNGAKSKYTTIYNLLHPTIYGCKDRNPKTGSINNVSIDINNVDIKNKNVMIIDDICDGGATFINLAKELKKYYVNRVDLFVSHGIFSKGIEVLKENGINNICTKTGIIY